MAAGKALRHWAWDRGFSLKELAAKLNIGRMTLTRYIHGHTRPLADHRISIERLTEGKIPHDAWSSDRELEVSWKLIARPA